MPAKLSIDDARDITVETLPPAAALPVIPICDLFQDLTKWKDQRIAVRADVVRYIGGCLAEAGAARADLSPMDIVGPSSSHMERPTILAPILRRCSA